MVVMEAWSLNLRRTNNRRHMSVVQVCVLYKYMLTEEKYDNFFLSIFFYKPITKNL